MTNKDHAHGPVYLSLHRAHLGLILSLTRGRGGLCVISSFAQQTPALWNNKLQIIDPGGLIGAVLQKVLFYHPKEKGKISVISRLLGKPAHLKNRRDPSHNY